MLRSRRPEVTDGTECVYCLTRALWVCFRTSTPSPLTLLKKNESPAGEKANMSELTLMLLVLGVQKRQPIKAFQYCTSYNSALIQGGKASLIVNKQ